MSQLGLKFKEDAEAVYTTEPWYDLFEGGYIRPEDLLEDEEQIYKVKSAVGLIQLFMTEAEDKGLIEIG